MDQSGKVANRNLSNVAALCDEKSLKRGISRQDLLTTVDVGR